MDAMQILVIILSVFLALFLLLSTILAIMLIRITRQINRVANSAQRTVASVAGIASKVGTITSVRALSRVVKAFIKDFKK